MAGSVRVEAVRCGPTGRPGIGVAKSSGNVAAGVASASIVAAANQVPYIEGFEFTGLGATGASIVNLTVAGLNDGAGNSVTFSYAISVPAGAAVQIPNLIVEFVEPIAGLLGGTITVSVPSLGAGNTNSAVNVHGFVADVT